jgi:hypothetical protein
MSDLEKLTQLSDIPDKPDDAVDSVTPGEYNSALDENTNVHSLGSLEKSRKYCHTLLEELSDSEKAKYIKKILDHELKLQSSIKDRSYDDAIAFRKVQNWIAIGVCICTFFVATVSIIYVWFHPNNTNIFDKLVDYSKWMYYATVAQVIVFYFSRKNNVNPKKTNKQDP